MHAGKKGVTSQAFVQEVWLAGVPVNEVWSEGTKFYPDERTTVRDLVLSTPEGDTRYWKHAVHAAAHGEALMEMTLGERRFHLGTGDGSLPVLRDVGGAWRVEEGDLLLSEVLRKDVVVHADVPQRTGLKKVIHAYESWYMIEWNDLPMLGGMQFGMELRNYSRKRSLYSGWRNIVSSPSGMTWQPGGGIHKNVSRPRTPAGLITDAGISDDDVSYSIECMTSGGAYYDPGAREYQYVFPIWPAFERTWSLRVLGCTLQHRK